VENSSENERETGFLVENSQHGHGYKDIQSDNLTSTEQNVTNHLSSEAIYLHKIKDLLRNQRHIED